ncbi:restriction endonuclease subunit S [Prevotella corporis]|uniref:restriction endonuclease subunit S n=1 Tax=Prevotella corporis TaxID=28128 RepID=UPI0023F153C9|nr:restriction endonuclease subunit S [Prevotella corporis]
MRFKEFEEEWEECFLSDILEFKNGLNPKANKFGKGTKFISVMDILNNIFITYDCIKATVEATEEEKLNFSVEKGDILFQRSSETLDDVGRANVYMDERPAIFGGFVIRGKKKGEYNPLFFRYLLSSPCSRRKIIPMGAGAQHFNIGQEGLSKVKLNFASLSEQGKIGKFLSLIDERIATQNKIIEELKKLKVCVRRLIFRTLNCSWFLLSELEASGDICLKRGNIIPKHEHTDIFCYPVYSSSVQNGGLMGYNNTYMFNTELVTWSIDGGGNFFYRHKHKFNVTNVSGYMQLNEAKYNYRFVSEILLWQHSFMVFDYQTKAHPSVIRSIYKLPDVSLAEQELIANIFRLLDVKLQNEMTILKQYQQQKQYLLCQMFI